MNQRKGEIKRPPGATDAIFRIVGDAEQHLTDGIIDVDIPNVRKEWDQILYEMFAECDDTPLARAGGELID